MFLIITALAAIVTTIILYINSPKNRYKLSTLSLIYWGATLMWVVDHVMAYLRDGGNFFEITLNATLLGITVVLLGLLAWAIIRFLKYPKAVLRGILHSKM